MVKQWEDLQQINKIARPWPVYMGLREVQCGYLYTDRAAFPVLSIYDQSVSNNAWQCTNPHRSLRAF